MKKPFIIHPFLFATYPILFLFAHNISRFSLNVILIPIAITTCFALLSQSLLSFVLKDKKKAGLIVSLFLLLFFSYGHFYNAVVGFSMGGFSIGRHRYLLPTCSMFFISGAYFTIMTRRSLNNFTGILNITAAFLIAISSISIGTYKLKTRVAWQDDRRTENTETKPIDLGKISGLPSIYYIILDGYARADILKDMYHYNNTELLDYLTQKDFYIANKSRSNYCQTDLSLASSLNFKYLNDLVDRIGIESDNRIPLVNMIRNNRVFRFLKQYGYVIVAFSSGSSPTEIRNTDIYMKPLSFLGEFQIALINTTAIAPVLYKVTSYGYGLHRKRILYTFDHLVDTIELQTPIFVFAHIMAPHPPFVFGQNGEKVRPNTAFSLADGADFFKAGGTVGEYLRGYRSQLIYINKKLITTVDNILSKSAKPPIIILQSDHGSRIMMDWENADKTYFKETFSILNAYYLPNNIDKCLYESVTPVNTFRIIFNHYFDTDYELLKDESYFSTCSHPYKFINVTDKINSDVYTERPG